MQIGFASSHFRWRLLQVPQPVNVLDLGSFRDDVAFLDVVFCFFATMVPAVAAFFGYGGASRVIRLVLPERGTE